jgi:hypothetical protein
VQRENASSRVPVAPHMDAAGTDTAVERHPSHC